MIQSVTASNTRNNILSYTHDVTHMMHHPLEKISQERNADGETEAQSQLLVKLNLCHDLEPDLLRNILPQMAAGGWGEGSSQGFPKACAPVRISAITTSSPLGPFLCPD